MSRPRPVYPGRCYLVTRRTYERRYFLRPDSVVNQSFWYILGWAAARHNIGVVAACALSNHYHLVIVDRDGCFPNFIRDFNAMLARCLNAHRGRWEAVWTNTQTSMVALVDEAAQLEKSVYTLANPALGGLVRYAHDWPGASSLSALRAGRSITAKRPRHFFREMDRDEIQKGSKRGMPEEVTIDFVPPPAFEGKHAEFACAVSNAVHEAEEKAEAERSAAGLRALGRKAVLAQDWNASPLTPAPRKGMSPRVAARDKHARMEALGRNKQFEAAHQAARLLRLAGVLDVIFPTGTWLMVQQHRVPVVPFAPD